MEIYVRFVGFLSFFVVGGNGPVANCKPDMFHFDRNVTLIQGILKQIYTFVKI